MNLFNDIMDNLNFLDIDIKGKSFDDILKKLYELKTDKYEGLVIETILKINMLVGSDENENN